MKTIRIGSRGSRLARAQSQEVQSFLKKENPELKSLIQVIRTTGDQNLQQKFSEIGTKGIFTKEIDEAVLDGRVDFAVHSLKDLTSELMPGLKIAAFALPTDPRDVLISKDGSSLKDFPKKSVVGTASLRRMALLKKARPDLQIQNLRGNVDTRLKKLDQGEYHAIVLAAAGLCRLRYQDRITEYLNPYEFVPAIGQGTLALVCREQDSQTIGLLKTLDDEKLRPVLQAQRVFMQKMEGGCRVPLGCYAEISKDKISLFGYLASADGDQEIRKRVEGEKGQEIQLANQLAQSILEYGGQEIIQKIRSGEGY